MDFSNHSRINEQILMGNFPDCQIKRDTKREVLINNISNIEKRGHAKIRRFDIPLFLALQAYSDQARTFLCDNGTEAQSQDLNFLVNTLINPETVNSTHQTVQKAIQRYPAVTNFDQALWWAAFSNHEAAPVDPETLLCLSYAWIRLLRNAQQNELMYKKTIDLSLITESTPILDILYKSWDEIQSPCFVALTSQEIRSLENLTVYQEQLREQCLELVDAGDIIAEQTEIEWDLFLNILNDLQLQESTVAAQICDSISPAEKMSAIIRYNNTINQISAGIYSIKGENIPLEPLFDAVKKRLENAPAHCFVSDNCGNSFLLCPEIVRLIQQPTTFNYIFIAYHHFRLDATKDNALRFLQAALHCLRQNFGVTSRLKLDTIDEIAISFNAIVKRFYKENYAAISHVSFSKLQQDAIINGEVAQEFLLEKRIRSNMYTAMAATLSQPDTFQSQITDLSHLKEFEAQFLSDYYANLGVDPDNFEQAEERLVSEEIVRPLVVSLNVIYLFCDALKIISDESTCHSFVQDLDSLDECRESLQHIHNDVAYKVYRDVNLSKHRRTVGIDAGALARQESHAERLRINTFLDICTKYLAKLNTGIRVGSIDGLLSINRQFRAEILRCPPFLNKDEHTKKLEKVSNDICNSLVEAFEAESPEMLKKETQVILGELGAEAQSLPDLTIKSLATAELLFHKFASIKYQMEGFDYSSISALYYQAFEHAYNSLIWKKYVAYLDSVQIGNQRLAEYLYQCKLENEGIIENPSALGYLPEKDYSKYLKNAKNNQPACFNPSITYGIFNRIISDIADKQELSKLCTHFAESMGFFSLQSMLEDKVFMAHFRRFVNKVNKNTGHRNRASHGGNEINFRMCSDDKKAVLFDLENVRKDSISLIQLLLYLMSYSKRSQQDNN